MKDVLVKAKAKMGKLPSDNLYNNLIHESNLDRKIEILKKEYNFLHQAKSKKDVEESFFNNFYEELKSLDFFLQGIESEFFKAYFDIYEIYLIQRIIQSIVNDTLEKNILSLSKDPFSKNIRVKLGMSLKDFVYSLKESKYYRTLLPFINEKMDKDSLIFLSSNALMKFYYRDLLKIAKKFNAKQRVLIENFIGELINLSNFEMVFRLKKFFNLNDNEIFNYLIEGGKGYNGDRLKALSNLSIDEFLDKLSSSKYGDIFDDIGYSHVRIKKMRMKIFNDEIVKQRSDILSLISAMRIIRINYGNLISLLEVDESFTLSERYELVIER
ncbi:MAG: V-type ATPase subunit [Anaerococcus sp.]|nr:V-type ATPase subunit [Anaerococcus sp.]